MSDTGFEKIVNDIEAQLQDEQEILRQIEERLAISRERVKRLEQAKQSLSGEGKAKAGRGRPHKRPSNDDWVPTPDSIQAIMTVLAESPAPMTVKEIEEATQRSHSHVDGVVRYLRRHELVRLAGQRGSANLYAPMNNSGLKETEHAAQAA